MMTPRTDLNVFYFTPEKNIVYAKNRFVELPSEGHGSLSIGEYKNRLEGKTKFLSLIEIDKNIRSREDPTSSQRGLETLAAKIYFLCLVSCFLSLLDYSIFLLSVVSRICRHCHCTKTMLLRHGGSPNRCGSGFKPLTKYSDVGYEYVYRHNIFKKTRENTKIR